MRREKSLSSFRESKTMKADGMAWCLIEVARVWEASNETSFMWLSTRTLPTVPEKGISKCCVFLEWEGDGCQSGSIYLSSFGGLSCLLRKRGSKAVWPREPFSVEEKGRNLFMRLFRRLSLFSLAFISFTETIAGLFSKDDFPSSM